MAGVALLSFYSAIEESILERKNGKAETASEEEIPDIDAVEASEDRPADPEVLVTDTPATENTLRFC